MFNYRKLTSILSSEVNIDRWVSRLRRFAPALSAPHPCIELRMERKPPRTVKANKQRIKVKQWKLSRRNLVLLIYNNEFTFWFTGKHIQPQLHSFPLNTKSLWHHQHNSHPTCADIADVVDPTWGVKQSIITQQTIIESKKVREEKWWKIIE